MEWLSKATEIIKLALKHIWAVAIGTGLLIFLPEHLLKRIRVEQFAQNFGTYIGIAFLFSTLIVAMQITKGLWHAALKCRKRKKQLKETLLALTRLDPREQAILREFYLQNRNTIQLPFDQATVAGLVRKGILCLVGTVAERSLAGMLVPMKLSPAADAHLTFEMIELPQTPLSEANIQFLRKNRPEFLPEIEQHNQLFHTTWTRRQIPY
jgi:hypothetical protein